MDNVKRVERRKKGYKLMHVRGGCMHIWGGERGFEVAENGRQQGML